MIRRLRPAILVIALLLTGAALDFRAQAVECVEDSHEWVDLGDCCWQLSPATVKLYLRECVNGQWVVRTSTYKCPREACS
jgi:hypothetical protein